MDTHGPLTHLEGRLLIYCWNNFTRGGETASGARDAFRPPEAASQSGADSNLLVLFFQTCSTAATSPHWRISVLSSATSAIRWLLLKASWHTTVRPRGALLHSGRTRPRRASALAEEMSGRFASGLLQHGLRVP